MCFVWPLQWHKGDIYKYNILLNSVDKTEMIENEMLQCQINQQFK